MAARKDLKPGIPIEVIGYAESIISALQDLQRNHSAWLAEDGIFSMTDDQRQHHYLRFRFDENRGEGEYVLVTADD